MRGRVGGNAEKSCTPGKGLTWRTCLFYFCRTLALYVLLHKHHTVHIMPILEGIENFEHTVSLPRLLDLFAVCGRAYPSKIWRLPPKYASYTLILAGVNGADIASSEEFLAPL